MSDDSYPPYTFEEGGVEKGIGVELARELGKRVGRPIEFKLMAWEKAQRMVLQGEADALVPMSITEPRKQLFDFSAPVFMLQFSIFTRSDAEEVSRLDDLRGLRVAATESGLPRQLLDAHGGLMVRPVKTHAEGFELLQKREVDAVFGDRWVGSYELAKHKNAGVRISDTAATQMPAAIAVRKGNSGLVREIDTALKAMREDGSIDRLLRRWQPKEVVFLTRAQVTRWGVAGVIAILSVALGVMAFWLRRERREVFKRRQAEERITALNQRLSVATSSGGIGVWDWDVENDVLIWDKEMYRLYGVKEEDFAGAQEAWVRALHPDDRNRAQSETRAALRGARPFNTEFRIVWPEGDVRVIKASAQVFMDAAGRPLRMVGVNSDVTEQKRAEEALRRSEDRFSKAFRSSPVAVAVTNMATGRFIEVNAAMERFLGYSRDELIGRTTLELGLWVNLEDRQRMLVALVSPGWMRDEEIRFRHKGGSEVVSQYSAEPFECEGERHVLSVLVDITARKRAQEERQRLVHDLGERVKELTALHQTSRLLQAERPVDLALLEELAALLPPAWQYPEVCAARISYGDWKATTPGWRETPWMQKEIFSTRDGRSGAIEVVYLEAKPEAAEGPFLAEERTLIKSLAEMLAGSFEGRNAAEALARSEARFRSAMVNSAVGMAIVGPDGNWIEVNPALCRIVGYSREELLARDFQSITHPEDLPTDLIRLKGLLAGDVETVGWEKRYVHKSGENVWVQLNVSIIRDQPRGSTSFVTLVQDISGRKQAEASLAAAAERLTLALRVSRLGVWRHNLQTRETEWDEQMFALFDLPVAKEAPDVDAILARVVEEDRAAVQRSWNVQAGCTRTYQIRFRVASSAAGVRQIDVQGVVHMDSQGRPEWAIGVAGDITEIIESAAEAERLRARLQQAQKMEALGTLAAGVAHDFNNLLTGINGFVDLATTSLPANHEATNLLKQARTGATSARDLVRRILDFSRTGTGRTRARVDLNEMVRETAGLLAAALPARIAVRLELGSEPVPVLTEGRQLQQVLMNLCTNGAHAIGEKAGALTIRTRICEHTQVQDSASPFAALKGGHYACLSVTDTGSGMDEKTRKRLFEPFFTTKKPGEGTGLGLSIVRDIVSAHGGAIDVASRLGQGTTFSVYLPLAPNEKLEPAAQPEETAKGGGGCRVLVVDDEPSVGMVLRLALQKHGYAPEIYSSPNAAWERFAGMPEAFDLLIIDQNMPEISGREFIRKVRALRPGMPVVLLSGRFESGQNDGVPLEPITLMIQKPFEIAGLIRAVERVLKESEHVANT